MDQLDIYDENGKPLGRMDSFEVHAQGVWHKTVHCWLYTKSGDVLFQMRADGGKCYTTASGHIVAGETMQQGFAREVFEELGYAADINAAQLVEIIPWRLDKGTAYKDRAFANVYIAEFGGQLTDFNYQTDEVSGIVKVNARKCLEIFKNGGGKIEAEVMQIENEQKKVSKRKFTLADFLVFGHESAITKYGRVLEAIINATR